MDFTGMTVGEIRASARAGAQAVLKEYWDGAFPVAVVDIARELGASVFTAELGENAYGMLTSDSAGKNIYIDRDQSIVRQRFTCAHEIGHLYSHADDPAASFVDMRDDAGLGEAPEIYANEFAACLLMPEHQVRVLSQAGYETARMAKYFDVSLPAMSYRMKRLGA